MQEQINYFDEIMEIILKSGDLRNTWSNYQKQFGYAKDITFDDVCGAIKSIIHI